MSKFWQVVVHEYTRHVFRWRFVFSLISLPLFLSVAFVVLLILISIEQKDQPIGFVDHSGLMSGVKIPVDPNETLSIFKFNSEAEAEAALNNEQIHAYYVLEEDYLQSSRARLVALEPPSGGSHEQFRNMVRERLLANQPSKNIKRLNQGNKWVLRNVDNSQQFKDQDRFKLLSPILVLFVFFLTIFTTTGYLMQAMTEEKENRTMEVIITSISAAKMMAAKITAIIGIGITQLLVWFGLFFIGFSIRANSTVWTDTINIPIGLAFLMILSVLLAFIMLAAIIAAIGAIVTEATEGQQITGPFSIPFIFPYFFLYQIISNPSSLFATILTFIPFTAPATLIMRTSLAEIPTWQVLISLVIQIICALFLVWIAGIAFRQGMLQYGRHLTWRELFNRSG